MIASKTASRCICEKIAKSGLVFNHLLLAFMRGGNEGVRSLFTELVNGKPRVTRSTKIINAVSQYLATHSDKLQLNKNFMNET